MTRILTAKTHNGCSIEHDDRFEGVKAVPLRAPLVVTRGLRLTGEQIVTWRKLQGLTAEQVAERAGISRNTLRSIEQGTGNASSETCSGS